MYCKNGTRSKKHYLELLPLILQSEFHLYFPGLLNQSPGLKWISQYWLAVSSITLELFVAFIIYRWFQPSWETMQTLSLNWVALIWIRNLILLTLFAGSLHLWFITFAAQDKKLKFDKRDQIRNNRTYSFRNQVWDNIFWSLCQRCISVDNFGKSFIFGPLPMVLHQEYHLPATPIWFVIWFALIPLWSSFHFYWIHRLLHWPPLYRLAHSVHHRNINIGPWSGISMHPIETIIFFSSVAIHFSGPVSSITRTISSLSRRYQSCLLTFRI